MEKLARLMMALLLSLLAFGGLAAAASDFPCEFARVASHGRTCAPAAPVPQKPLLVSMSEAQGRGA
jgi:hypothetical protein